jgi:hypothetical protein
MYPNRLVFAALLLTLTAMPCLAADEPDCSTFTWDMSRELALFAGAGKTLAVGTTAKDAPRIDVNTLYVLDLRPLGEITLAHAPGKTFGADAVGSGGLLIVRIAAAGRYRITLDAPMWVDVINADERVQSIGFQGQKPCTLIHKSVEWSLPANVDLIVQVTGGGAREHAKLAVTPAPAD